MKKTPSLTFPCVFVSPGCSNENAARVSEPLKNVLSSISNWCMNWWETFWLDSTRNRIKSYRTHIDYIRGVKDRWWSASTDSTFLKSDWPSIHLEFHNRTRCTCLSATQFSCNENLISIEAVIDIRSRPPKTIQLRARKEYFSHLRTRIKFFLIQGLWIEQLRDTRRSFNRSKPTKSIFSIFYVPKTYTFCSYFYRAVPVHERALIYTLSVTN